MKKILKRIIFLFSICGALQAGGQNNEKLSMALSNQFKRTVGALDKVNIMQKKEVKKVAEQNSQSDLIILESLAIFEKGLAQQRKEIAEMDKEYLPVRSSKPGQFSGDFVQLINGMPEPISNLGQAKLAMKPSPGGTIFLKYKEKLESSANQLQQTALANYPDKLKDRASLEGDAKANARQAEQVLSSNAMIQEMGGLEKLKNMSQAEREALGKQMAAKMKQNPNDYLPQGDPRKVFARKLMMDPSYNARYQHMNKQQQEEEYKIFMAENGFVNVAVITNDAKADRVKALTSIEIDKRVAAINQHTKEMAAIVGELRKKVDEYYANLEAEAGRQYAAYVSSLPEVEHGEAGKSKETYSAEIAYQIVILPIHAHHAIANKEVWMNYVQILKITIDEYNELLSEYWKRDPSTELLMQQRNLTPATLSFGLCNELISLTRQAGEVTSHHAGWQIAYDEKVLQLYD